MLQGLMALTVTAPQGPNAVLSNGVKMPLMACGSGGDNDAEARKTVKLALATGFAHIDTAHDYGCISGVSSAISEWTTQGAASRADIFLTSKVPGCGVPTQGLQPPCFENTYAMAASDIGILSKGSNQSYVDLMLLHFPPITGCGGSSCTKIQEQWTALERVYSEGKARAIGVSNYCRACIDCVLENATIPPMVNQLQYHVGMGADPDGTISYCSSKNITVMAYSPLAGGRLLSDKTFSALGEELAPRYSLNSSAQVAMAYVAQRGLALVTKSDNAEYLAEDLSIFGSSNMISAADRSRLDALVAPSCSIEAPGGCCKNGEALH